nr:response regulator [Lachnospiraceae bacterium]
TGLGMSIVKQLLAMMDSQLVVKSVYGEGSDFSFEIKQKVLSWEPIGNFNEAYERSLENNRKYKERFRAPDARILITDDTRMNLTVACGLLKRTLIRIDTAESGKQTLEMVQKQKYDVIFLDHRMPEMDGVETLQAMRALGEYINADTPVIALTANAVSGAREFYLEAGFADYFTKPIDGVKLEKLLQDYIPADKIRDTSEEEQSAESGSTEPAGTDESSGEGEEDVLANLPGIDYKAAMANCVTREILESAMKDYLAGISETADKIRDFAEKEDVRNYTVLVHALKSSSRLIGALHLSEAAAYLEKCGDEGNLAEIREKTPALLEEYRGYAQVLGFLEDSGEEDEDKPLIDPDQLKEAYAGLKEFVSAFDFDSADAIINMLNDYRVAPEEKEHFNEVKKRLTNVDRDGLLEIL